MAAERSRSPARGGRVAPGVSDDKGGVVLKDISLTGISGQEDVIFNASVLTLRNVTVADNAVVNPTSIATIVNNIVGGTLYVEGLTVSQNTVNASSDNAAAYVIRSQGVIHVAQEVLLSGNAASASVLPTATFHNLGTINTYGADLIQLTGNTAGGVENDAILQYQPVSASDYTPPSGGAGGVTVTFTEGDSAVLIVPEAAISDEDSADLSALTVTLDSVADGSSLSIDTEALALITQDIAAAYDSATGTLTLTAANGAPVADFEAALRLVRFANTGDDPQNRSIAITVTDSEGNVSDPATVTVAVTGVNDAPTLVAEGDTGKVVGAGLTSGGVTLFSGTVIDTVEAGQKISEVVLKATGLANGASEILTVDGTKVTLTDGTSTGVMPVSAPIVRAVSPYSVQPNTTPQHTAPARPGWPAAVLTQG